MKMGSPERTSSAKDGTKMDWMYKGPAALVDRDDYLKGRSVDKSLKMLDEAEKGNKFSYADEVEKDLTPISIFSSRGSAGPIDVIRKIKEDPLFQIQKKEEEHLRQLLNNPVRMKRLRDLAEKNKKDQDKSRKSNDRKKHKKKRSTSSSSSSSSSDDSSDDDDDGDIDKILAEKLKSMKDVKEKLMTKKAKESSSSSDEDHKKSKSSKRSKLDDRQREKPHSSSSTSSSRVRDPETDRDRDRDRPNRNERDQRFDRDRYRDRERDHDRSSNFNSTASREDRGSHRDRDRRDRDERGDAQRNSKNYHSQPASGRSQPRPAPQQKKPLDDAEKERRLKEMMENSKWREQQRTQNVNKHREEVKREEDKLKAENNTDFIRKQLVEAASTGSIEKRIKSNSYNIQRSKSSMNQNFAKR